MRGDLSGNYATLMAEAQETAFADIRLKYMGILILLGK